MDIIKDLTAQAVSYLTVYQDIQKDAIFKSGERPTESKTISIDAANIADYRLDRIMEIYTINRTVDKTEARGGFLERTRKLYSWIQTHSEEISQTESGEEPLNQFIDEHIYKTPSFWRAKIRQLLNGNISARTELSLLLKYLPYQIILLIGGQKIKNREVSLYSYWDMAEKETTREIEKPVSQPSENAFNNDDKNVKRWWEERINSKIYKPSTNLLLKEEKITVKLQLVLRSLGDDTFLRKMLLSEEIAYPFESLFGQELEEIGKSRGQRAIDVEQKTIAPEYTPAGVSELGLDPELTAGTMKLRGLALSGGGIRSATFNLGVIQKLAQLGALNSFDYLSTVSGGGYIGSWLVSWIKRSGSITKVAGRLDPKRSVDPMADEVMPIRWLRMYSNYLSPNASIMSADAWTSGMTWLRNTIINQIVLLLLLCSSLSIISTAFEFWRPQYGPTDFDVAHVTLYSFIILIIGAILTGLGMRPYDSREDAYKKSILSSNTISMILIIWAVATGLFVSSWFYTDLLYSCSYGDNFVRLSPAAIMCFFSMMIVAWLGRYGAYAKENIKKEQKIWSAVLASSLLAALTGWLAISGVWTLFNYIVSIHIAVRDYQPKLIFIFGVPLILEAISICVVTRMAIMGKLFPDERREWWGRTGGILHRVILIWILATTGALILPDEFKHEYENVKRNLLLAFGSWSAVIGIAVKKAYSAALAKKSDQPGPKILNTFVKIAPYLFMLGFLLIGAYTLEVITGLLPFKIGLDKSFTYFATIQNLILSVILIIITLLISWRTGVNEFSLHHFYRNRLTRAYLGATRRRADRERTANDFTGFDTKDDLPMTDFLVENEYYGPYPILNTTLNATDYSALDRQDRKAESFVFSPLYCGFDFSATRSSKDNKTGIFNYGYRPTAEYSNDDGGPLIGSVMAMSGAAVSPNMGYHSSPATAFLLTMFNVRLGRWIGNPRLGRWRHSEPSFGIGYLVKDLIGRTDINNDYVYLSDGGHFDNMGIYELVRRRCHYILLGDGEGDPKSTCEGLANAIRRCRIDFGVEIVIDIRKIIDKDKDGFSDAHCVKGIIQYPDEQEDGTLVYVKTSLAKDNDVDTTNVDVREYHMNNPVFPQESTGDQFFNEAQFESYRKLGYSSIKIADIMPDPPNHKTSP